MGRIVLSSRYAHPMKFFALVILACWVGLVDLSAQTQIYPASGSSTSATNIIVSSGNLTVSGGFSPPGIIAPYGSGNYPHLQAALLYLLQAQEAFNEAEQGVKAQYLPRAKTGVITAISDVQWAIDHSDGKTTPTGAALSELPSGVGRADSTEMVVATINVKIASPNMEAANNFLENARNELNLAAAQPAGVFMGRALADIQFTLDNSNAAINLVNSNPATQPKPPGMAHASTSTSAAASTPSSNVNGNDLVGPLSLLAVLAGFGAVQLMRNRGQG